MPKRQNETLCYGRGYIEDAPDWGYCVSQGLHYYDYNLHAVCGIGGIIHSYEITYANVHDIHYLNDVRWKYHDCMMLGDKRTYQCGDSEESFRDS